MKIRSGFVTNSSSTSFLLIAKEDFSKANFFELVGIDPSSPVIDLFSQLYDDLLEKAWIEMDFKKPEESVSIETLFDKQSERLSPRMLEKIKEAKERGFKIYYGSLGSESSMIQTFFCTESFEVENEKIYFNGLECIW